MKKNIVYSIFAVIVLLTASCRKEDNPRIGTLTRVPVPYIKADATKSQSISVNNPTSFNQTFTFAPFFTNDVPPKQMDLVVIKNGVNSSVKTVQAGFTTFPASVNVTGAQLVSMFGTIKLGDNFTFGLDITAADGTVFHAFPALGVGYGSGVLNEYNGANVNVTPIANGGGVVYQLNYGALCTYDPNIYEGNFKATDAWGDADGAIIVLTKIDNTHFSFKYPSAVNATPIIVTVNPLNNTVTIPQVTIGTAWSTAYGYPATATYANPSINTATGTVAPCDQTVTLSIKWGTAGGTLEFGGGPYTLVLKKQ